MDNALPRKTCFVVMPFGEKTDFDGNSIDFDDIYRFFIKRTLKNAEKLRYIVNIECIRCDEIEESGSIHEKMFQQIYNADIVIVDISTANANVYYELGVRHALTKGITVLIRRKGTNIPFNIQGLQVVEYDQGRFSSIEQAKSKIQQIILNGLQNRRNDSPVHAVLELNIERDGKPIEETKFHDWRINENPEMSIGLVTGDIQNVRKGIDVWVNSENTNMQMARPYENSISGIIRYLGAEKDPDNGRILSDTIVNELKEKMNDRSSVDAASVVVTHAGAMEKSHHVKRIFHAAANYGQVGQGYIPIDYVARCVTNALTTTPEDSEPGSLNSILFPLMATRSEKGAVLEDRVRPLFNAAIDYLVNSSRKTFRKVYFLAYTDKELSVCRSILQADKRLTMVVPPPSSDGPATEPQVSGGPAGPNT